MTAAWLAAVAAAPATAQSERVDVPVSAPSEAPAFRSGVSLVSVSAVVRDKRGRVQSSLSVADFEITDEGRPREVVQFHADSNAPASVAILIDGSGSMVLGAALERSRQISTDLLRRLTPGRDAAALLSFDTRLRTLCEFTSDLDSVRDGLGRVEAFGSTSLYDAIAGSAGLVADRARNRRAVIVLTDGTDTASRFSPDDVAVIASTIDVPVYVFAVGADQARPADAAEAGDPLAALARATGGDLFVANTPARIVAAVARVADDLRHQYVIAFEAAGSDGMRRVQVSTRDKDLKVHARRWYQGSLE
jgi:VWFA-related protein